MRALIALAALILLLAFAAHARGWLRIDRCLDNGGAWDDQQARCIADDPVTKHVAPAPNRAAQPWC